MCTAPLGRSGAQSLGGAQDKDNRFGWIRGGLSGDRGKGGLARSSGVTWPKT